MKIDIARAWKNAQYRESLTGEELTQLPENPIGTLELTDEDLLSVDGACGGSCGGSFGGYGIGYYNRFDGGFGDGGSYSFDGGSFGGFGLGGRVIFGGGCGCY